MLRDIIEINEDDCIGCGNCVPNCHQGALQVIDGKARLISDLMCEGIGACVGHCPTGAMTVEKREAEPYDEVKVIEKLVKQGPNVVKAHIDHLEEHKQDKFLSEALNYLNARGYNIPEGSGEDIKQPEIKPLKVNSHNRGGGGCPGSLIRSFGKEDSSASQSSTELKQWPVQLHLVSPSAPYYNNADVLLAADCTAFSLGNFHSEYLKGKALAIACPKLDHGTQTYIDKIKLMIDESGINTITVLMMEVPCCSGLLQMAQEAVEQARRKVPVKRIVVSVEGEVLSEEWL